MGRPGQIRTLVVEDDPALRRFLRMLLEASGRFEVIADADNGVRAIEEARILQPELVLLDLMMPVMNGFQALPKILDVSRGSRVVVLTMRRDNPIEREVLALGAAAFLDKSLSDDEILRRLLAVMEPLGPLAQGGPGPSAPPPAAFVVAP